MVGNLEIQEANCTKCIVNNVFIFFFLVRRSLQHLEITRSCRCRVEITQFSELLCEMHFPVVLDVNGRLG